MENYKTATEPGILIKKFGTITNQEIILKNGNIQNKINFESIDRVNLIKHRVYFTNLAFLIISSLLMITIFVLHDIQLISKMGIALVASGSFILSISHKFYFYLLIIKLNNKENFKVKSTQFHRDCMKEFYFSILKKVKKNKQVLFEKPIEYNYSA